jgi:hypothetical protein
MSVSLASTAQCIQKKRESDGESKKNDQTTKTIGRKRENLIRFHITNFQREKEYEDRNEDKLEISQQKETKKKGKRANEVCVR